MLKYIQGNIIMIIFIRLWCKNLPIILFRTMQNSVGVAYCMHIFKKYECLVLNSNLSI